ncbi:DUF6939 family protein [Actinomadura montaniterrae]|uniref:Uncharacterized protein n=1 Tax=Actinomadura montaniterrae TaxID=1803903 RepID=A0A6L3VYI7_9ACTN|nr:hypothetical protein [Actinomadura montaniterrae]KAB2380673.1 hypothetical protein F9B16_17385 [Actinomadura montaniterrae]
MGVHVASRRRARASVEAEWPGAVVLDVTSRGPQPWVRFSPFYPHGGIPVPLSDGATGASVEGIWQALKVFEGDDVDPARLAITSMKGIKRTVRKYGPVRGHRAGLDGDELLPYGRARREIYLPAYRWVLENEVADLVEEVRRLGEVVLLDYTVNGDVDDLSKPLSHAALIALFAEDRWP